MGVKTDFSIVPGRIDFGAATIGPMEGDVRMSTGYNNRGYVSINFPRGVSPALRDLVCMCEWDKATPYVGKEPKARIIRIWNTFVIRDLNPHFEREVAFFQCGAEQYQIQDSLLGELVPRLSAVTILPDSKLWTENKYW